MLYTKSGDKGKTSLLGGNIVNKDDAMVKTYGSIDELNSFIGNFICNSKDKKLVNQVEKIQSNLFIIGSYFADDTGNFIKSEYLEKLKDETKKLEGQIDIWEEQTPKLTNFILPGGTDLASKAHIIRTQVRRAERQAVSLNRIKTLDTNVLAYLNRLSDYFFVLARYINFKAGVKEKIWKM